MSSNRPFEPFNLAAVMQNAEALKGMRRASVLDDLQAQYLGGQIKRSESAEGRAQSQEDRASTEFDQEQQVVNTRLLNMAAAEVAQNPAAAQRWDPIIKAAIPNWEPIQGGDPAQIQAAAKQLFESTSQALQAYTAGSGVTQAKPSALIEQYNQAVAEGYKGGYLNFVQEQSQRQVGAQYGAPVNQPGLGIVQPSRVDPTRNITLTPEADVVSAGAERAGSEATAQTQAREAQQRFSAQIDEGFAAADSMPVLRRGLELLDQGIQTGGYNALELWAKNRLGVTGADEGELSANLGKAVLAQLRSTFGAQFTEREGARLAELEGGFGKSAAVNRRLLQQALQLVERTARRGVLAARRSGDDETARMIEEAMNERLEYGDTQQPEAGANGQQVGRFTIQVVD
jgi:hypothetical protein